MMKVKRIYIAAEVTRDFKRALVHEAKAQRRKLSDYIRLVLEERLAKNGNGTRVGGAQ